MKRKNNVSKKRSMYFFVVLTIALTVYSVVQAVKLNRNGIGADITIYSMYTALISGIVLTWLLPLKVEVKGNITWASAVVLGIIMMLFFIHMESKFHIGYGYMLSPLIPIFLSIVIGYATGGDGEDDYSFRA